MKHQILLHCPNRDMMRYNDHHHIGGLEFRTYRPNNGQCCYTQHILRVSHAAAICAYLTKYCTISVVNASEKTRCIQFGNETILYGQIDTPCAFVLKFEQDYLVEITYAGKKF